MLRFKIKDGQAAIYDPVPYGDAPLTNPRDHLDLLKWHNELEHIGIVERRTYSVSLPAPGSGALREITHVLDTHGQPQEPFIYGYVALPGGARRPFSMHAFVSAAVGHYNNDSTREAYGRHLSLGVDGPNIVLHEFTRNSSTTATGSQPHQAVTVQVHVFITNLSLAELGSSSPAPIDRSFRINANETKLGPFDANMRWLRIAHDEVQFPLINGRTMSGGTRRNWRYEIPSESAFAYSFSYGPSVPPPFTDATAIDVSA